MGIGERLKKLRIDNDYTLDEVGKYAGTSKQTMYKYENGIITNIPSDKIELFAKFFNVTPAYLMGWEQEQTEQYYHYDAETRQIADEISKDPQLKMLFSSARNAKAEDLKTVHEMLKALKRKEENRDD